MKTTRFGLILGYKDFFSDSPPDNRLDLLEGISKIDLLAEFAACNYRIKSPKEIFFDFSINKEISELQYHLRLYPDLRHKIISNYKNILKTKAPNAVIFNRASMIFAENEIINNSNLNNIADFRFTGYHQKKIFKYILLVNDVITDYNEELFGIESITQLEQINLASLALNEYFIPKDPLFTLYRGGIFYNYLENSEYSEQINNFLIENTGLSPQNFIFEIASIYFQKSIFPLYEIESNDDSIKLFNYLSSRNPVGNNSLELIDIKKSPFYKYSENKFLLLDNMFLFSLSYDFFIWNFLFDFLLKDVSENKERVSIIKRFKGELGQFYEAHLRNILKSSLEPNNYIVRTTDELKIKINGKEIELGDVYIRKSNKIIIGEAKTTGIINQEKYSGNLDYFTEENHEKFFEKHGINQLADNIRKIIDNGKRIDKSFPSKHLKIFPVLFYNDHLLNNVFFPQIFNDKLKSLIKDIEDPCVKIYPLLMVHIADIEVLEKSLYLKQIEIFDLLKKHLFKSKIILPFYLTANEKGNKRYPDRVDKYFKDLIKKYNVREK